MRLSLASALTLAAFFASGLCCAQEQARPAPYPACDRHPSETDITAAKGAFQAGNASFDEADYPRSIVYWEDAYRRDCTAHALLLNLARAYELAASQPQAVLALRTYLERVPGTPDKDKIARRIEVLEKQIQASNPASTTPAGAEPQQNEPEKTDPAAVAVEPSADGSWRAKRPIAPLIVAGAGVAVAATGVVLYAIAHKDVSDAEERCPDHKHCNDLNALADGNNARKRLTTGGIVIAGGGAMIVGGLVWYVLSKPSSVAAKNERKHVLTPLAGPSFLGLGYSGRF